MSDFPSFRLGFDGGGTQTRAVLIDQHCRVLGRGQSASSNPYAVGMERALDHIEAAASQALSEAKIASKSVSGWGLGLGGVCSPSESAAVEEALRCRIGAQTVVTAVEDVVAAWSGAFGGPFFRGQAPEKSRAVCIAGTGANCWGQNERGQIAAADGSGPLLGDRGSGYWIGEAALRHTARAFDGVLDVDELAEAVLFHFEVLDVKELIRLVYAADFQRSNVAGLVPTVIKHQKSQAAREILSAAGRELAATTISVLRQLSLVRTEIRGEVALIGGVLNGAGPVIDAFTASLSANAPDVHLVEAKFDAAVGAALLIEA